MGQMQTAAMNFDNRRVQWAGCDYDGWYLVFVDGDTESDAELYTDWDSLQAAIDEWLGVC